MNPTGPYDEKRPFNQGRYITTKLSLDLHKYTRRHDEAIQRLHRPGGRFEDVDHSLVRAHLELLATLLVNVRAPQNGVPLNPRRNRNRAANPRVGSLGVLHNLARRSIQCPMVIRFHSNPNPIALHNSAFPVDPRLPQLMLPTGERPDTLLMPKTMSRPPPTYFIRR